jgi:hypothetical protein
MAGHMVTPYELTATRKHARKEKDEKLLLAAIGKDSVIDLLDAAEAHLTSVAPVVYSDKTRTVSAVAVARDGDALGMVFASDVSGEREVVHDGAVPGRPVVFTKHDKHVTRFYSCCLLWRPPSGDAGLLLMHSPWGRGGSKANVLALVQRAVDAEKGTKAKLHADPMIPAKALDRFLRKAEATKIVYTRSTGVRSSFDDNSTTQSARAEMGLVVKGTDTLPYRDALAKALKKNASRDKLFTLRVRDETSEDGYREETFDDVYVDISTPGGNRRYSMKKDTIPTIGFNRTPEVNSVYYGLPDDDADGSWASGLLEGVMPHLIKVVGEVQADL